MRRARPLPAANARAERLRVGAAADEARPVAGGERRRLVEKEQLGVAVAPDAAMAALERADAGDPLPRRPAATAERLVGAMEAPAAVAHQRAARGDGDERAVGIDAVLQRPRSVHCALAAQRRAGATPRRSAKPARRSRDASAGGVDAIDVVAEIDDAVGARPAGQIDPDHRRRRASA